LGSVGFNLSHMYVLRNFRKNHAIFGKFSKAIFLIYGSKSTRKYGTGIFVKKSNTSGSTYLYLIYVSHICLHNFNILVEISFSFSVYFFQQINSPSFMRDDFEF